MAALCSIEHERLPLKQRLKILLANNQLADFLSTSNSSASVDDGVSKPVSCAQSDTEEKMIADLSSERSNGGKSSNTNEQDKVKNITGHMIKANHTMNADMTAKEAGAISSYGSLQEIRVKTEDQTGYFDELDHVLLVERRKMLLSRGALGLANPLEQSDSVQLSSRVLNKKTGHNAGIITAGNHYGEGGLPMAGDQLTEVQQTLNLDSSIRETVIGLFCQGREPTSGTTKKTEKRTMRRSKKKVSEGPASIGQDILSRKSTLLNPAVKLEPLNDNETCPSMFSAANLPSNHAVLVRTEPVLEEKSIGQEILSRKSALLNPAVKLEPLNGNGTCPSMFSVANLPSNHAVLVQMEPVLEDSKDDVLDHMFLRDRLKMTPTKEVIRGDVSSFRCPRKDVSPSLDRLVAPDIAKRGRSTQTRKRRKSVTDSVETALEEDAPGLLQMLVEKGVLLDEIKLYGETDNVEAPDDSSLEDSFSELEAVISKLFSQKTSLLKLEPLKGVKGDKVSYCLACLFSLVEQARYLQFRKWPVEWGWCRDLQSFIFVFERHHRIVLERPEYGYATYFFELLESLPITWQIKRLVTAMRLTSCSRITLIENKALVVGEDLTEGEAKVLMEYGWLPDTGLATMLNYCDRVIHDRHEKDTSEWKSKIGKLLIDGYNGGTIVSDNIPKKVEEYNMMSQSQPVKMELV